MGIYVVGMHRSGTSALSRALGIMVGYDGEAEPGRGNPAGHWENPRLRRELDLLMRTLGSDWTAPPAEPISWEDPLARGHREVLADVVASLGQRTWVLKDPRLCVALDAVASLPQAPPVVVNIYRHPVEVAASISARDGLPLMFGLALWEAYVRLQLRQGATATAVSWVAQDDLLSRSRSTLRALAASLTAAGVRVEDSAVEAAADSIDPSLRHASSGDSDPRNSKLSDQQRDLLEILRCRASGGRSDELPEMTPWAAAMIELRRPFSELAREHHVLARRMRRLRWAFTTYDRVKELRPPAWVPRSEKPAGQAAPTKTTTGEVGA